MVFAWASNAFVDALSATYEIIQNGEGDIWRVILYSMILFMVFAGISWIIATSVFIRVKKKSEKRIKDRIAQAESLEKKVSENIAEASENIAEARALIESGRKKFRELEELAARLKVEVHKRSMKENGQEEKDRVRTH